MAKEVEVKILEINVKKLKQILKENKADLVMKKNLQKNYFYSSPEIEKKGVIRLRTNINGQTIAIKSKLKAPRIMLPTTSGGVIHAISPLEGVFPANVPKIGWPQFSKILAKTWMFASRALIKITGMFDV